MVVNLKIRWKFYLSLGAILIIGILVFLFFRKAQERREFVGRVVYGRGMNGDWDKTSGYRCRFTVSSSCQIDGLDTQYKDTDRRLITLPASTIREWVDIHILHRPALRQFPIILLYGSRGVPRADRIVDGYPELFMHWVPDHVEIHRRLKIDGYSAVIDEFSTDSDHEMSLLVYVPEHDVLFSLNLHFDTSYNLDFMPLEHEMQAIIASFHVERVGSANSK